MHDMISIPKVNSKHIGLGWPHQSVGTPSPDNTWRASLSGVTPSGLPKEGHVARSPIRISSGRSTQHSQTSHPDYSISYPDMLSGSLTKVSKSYYVIPTACYSPRSATCRVKGQECSKSPSTISNSRVASHDL